MTNVPSYCPLFTNGRPSYHMKKR